MVEELVAIIEGSAISNTVNRPTVGAVGKKARMESDYEGVKRRPPAPARRQVAAKASAVNAEEVIPLDEEDFKDF
jgi:hypothetical protein